MTTLQDTQVQRLIYIVDAGVNERRRGHWYTLWIRSKPYCNLDEQLDAIRQLGESMDRSALDYLRKLNERKVETLRMPGVPSEDGSHVWYPHAKGELSKTLDAMFPEYYSGDPAIKHPRYGEAK